MELQQQYGSDVNIVGVPGSDNVESLQEFAERTGTTDVTHILDEGVLWDRFEVVSRQTYILVSADGTTGRVNFNDLDTTLADAVG